MILNKEIYNTIFSTGLTADHCFTKKDMKKSIFDNKLMFKVTQWHKLVNNLIDDQSNYYEITRWTIIPGFPAE